MRKYFFLKLQTKKTMKNKFYFLILIGLFTFCTPAKALLVNIPDANFRAYLQATYPTCFVGAQMETTCVGVITALSLNVNSLNIANLSGVQYFTSLQQLVCYQNQLTSLPALPTSLQILECGQNQLTSLPVLPASLTDLNCGANQLTDLPALPVSLQQLFCTGNQLTSLPALPASLVTLLCGGNQLTSLPALPVSLVTLLCDINLLDFADLEIINPKPATYIANPQSYTILPAIQNVSVGNPLTISGSVGGTLNVYQWYKNGTLISSATSATFSIPVVTVTDAGVYRCVVTSTFVGAGTTTGVTITSSNVNISVSCPTITFNNTTASAGATGTPYTLDASASNATSYSVFPALPVGLSLNTTTGVIFGTPTAITASAGYAVTATQGACTATQSYTFGVVCGIITSSISTQTNVSCFGGTNGSATVSVSGGTAPYTYLWSNGATSAFITGIIAGTYTCTITDANNCTKTQSVTITQPTAITNTFSQTNVSCFDGSNGSATVSVVSGGTTPYTYLWSNGATSAFITGITAGTYTCTITDANNCTQTQSVTITQPTAITNTFSQTNVSCFGGSNGSTTVSVVSGGVAPYTYSWSSSSVTLATRSGLVAGNYVCTITDATGCQKTQSFTITQPPALTNTVSQTNVSCFGGANGTATVVASGGTGAYTYLWSNGATNTSITSLVAGTYVCTITDANNCTKTQSVTITQPTAITNTFSQTNANCFGGSNGTATVVASGGTSSYTYSWSPSGGTSATASGLVAGTYVCTITDANSCTKTQSVTITQPVSALSNTFSQTNVSCFGGTNGTVTVVASGGTGAYSYSWSPSGGTSATASSLVAGTYVCTITDANSCTKTQSVTITQPVSALSNTFSQTNVSCFGGSNGTATVVASGGTGAYSYSWSPSGGTSATASGLITGTYTCTITDANNCTKTQSVIITQPTTTITINNANLPNATVGVAYSQTLTQTGLVGTPIWSVSAGALPTGFTLNASTGVIDGTTTSTTTANFTVSVTDGICFQTRVYSIVIGCPTMTFTNTTAPAAVTNCPYWLNASASNASSYGVFPVLPAGLSLNTLTGIISGSFPVATASNTYTVTAIQGSCSVTQNYTFAVGCATFINTNATDFIVGAGGLIDIRTTANLIGYSYAYSINPALPTGLVIVDGKISGVCLFTVPATTYAVTATNNGTNCNITQNYTFAVICPTIVFGTTAAANPVVGSAYWFSIGIAGANYSTSTISINPSLPAGLNLIGGIIRGTPAVSAPPTTYAITVIQGSCTTTQSYSFAVVCPTIAINPIGSYNTRINVFFQTTFSAVGLSGTPIWSLTGALPPGVTFNASNGYMSGTPTTIGNFNFTIGVTNGICSQTNAYSFRVSNCPTIFLSRNYLKATVGVGYNSSPLYSGHTYSISPSLPMGFTLNVNTGVISGTSSVPISIATYTITATAVGFSGCSSSEDLTFEVESCPIMTLANSPNSNSVAYSLVVGLNLPVGFSITGNPNNSNYSVIYSITPALPSGLSLNTSTGLIDGIPTTTMTSTNYTVIVRRGTMCSLTINLALTITGCPAFNTTPAPVVPIQIPYTFNAGISDPQAYSVTYLLSPTYLPQGLTFDTYTGVISGVCTRNTPSISYRIEARTFPGGSSNLCGGIAIGFFTLTTVCPVLSFTNTITSNPVVGNSFVLNAGIANNIYYNIRYVIPTTSPALPTGLSLNAQTGLISGIPTSTVAVTTYTVNALVMYGTGFTDCFVSQNYTFAVDCSAISPFNNLTAPDANVGNYYTFNTLTPGNGSNLFYSITPALPVGWGIGTNGAIMGWASVLTSATTYTITATQNGCSYTRTCRFAVVCPPATFTNTTATNAISGATYTLDVSATGWGITGYSINQVLPPGLNLNTSTGIISGYVWSVNVPSTTYIVTAIRGGNCNITQAYTFAVVCPTIVVGSASLPNGGINVNYNQTIPFTWGASAPIIWSVFSGNLPSGLALTSSGSFNMNGLISGIPTALGTFTFVIQTTSVNSCPRQTRYTLIITPNGGLRVNTIAEVISASPNPSSGDFNIDFSILDITNATMVLYNSQGRRVLSANIDNSQMLISLVNEPAGLYLLEITNASGKIIKRLIKQ